MIIWSGLGILAPFIPVVTWLFIPELFKVVFGDKWLKSNFSWLSGLSILIGALAVWFLGRYLNTKKGHSLEDANAGGQAVTKPAHSLFFIKMEYWSIPFGMLALYMLLTTIF